MKRFLSLLVIGLVGVIPFGVKAAETVAYKCTAVDANGERTCTISTKFEESTDQVDVTLTEKGGADLVSVATVTDSDWTMTNKVEGETEWTFTLTSPGVEGETSLYAVTYKVSGEEDCTIQMLINGVTKEITTDTKTSNKQTGSSVPYIALGAITLLAVGAYMTTKNKAKMFNI